MNRRDFLKGLMAIAILPFIPKASKSTERPVAGGFVWRWSRTQDPEIWEIDMGTEVVTTRNNGTGWVILDE